jgi:predicted ABC-type ATPase
MRSNIRVMSKFKKTIEIVAGPNGSGKSTFGDAFFRQDQESRIYLNPDLIASGLSLTGTNLASIQAGRILISEVKERISRGESFCFESTLSGLSWAPILSVAKEQGFEVIVYFLYLDSVSKNLMRIKKRVNLGGHFVPNDAVLRRYPKCFSHFWTIYRPLCDGWFVFDNSKSSLELKMSKTDFDLLSLREQKNFESLFLRSMKND